MMAEDTMEQLLIYIIPIVVGVSLGLILVIVRDWIKTPVTGLDLDSFKESMRKGQLLDLRNPKKDGSAPIKGARVISMRVLTSKNQTKVRKDLPVYLYHSTAFKAKKAAKKLGVRGFKSVFYLNQAYH